MIELIYHDMKYHDNYWLTLPPVICNQIVIIWSTPLMLDYVIYVQPLTAWEPFPTIYPFPVKKIHKALYAGPESGKARMPQLSPAKNNLTQSTTLWSTPVKLDLAQQTILTPVIFFSFYTCHLCLVYVIFVWAMPQVIHSFHFLS